MWCVYHSVIPQCYIIPKNWLVWNHLADYRNTMPHIDESTLHIQTFTHSYIRFVCTAEKNAVVVVFMTTDRMTRIKMKILWKKASPIFVPMAATMATTSAPLFPFEFIEHSNHIRKNNLYFMHLYTCVYPSLCMWKVNSVSTFGVMYVCGKYEVWNQSRSKSKLKCEGKTEIQKWQKQIYKIFTIFPETKPKYCLKFIHSFRKITTKKYDNSYNDDSCSYFIWIFFHWRWQLLDWMSVLVRYDTFGVFFFKKNILSFLLCFSSSMWTWMWTRHVYMIIVHCTYHILCRSHKRNE